MFTQVWVNREYRMGMSTHRCGAPVMKISEVEAFIVSFLHHLEAAHQKVQDPVAQGRVKTYGPKRNDELGGYYGV